VSARDLCPCCGQPLPPREHAGVYLPAKKAAVFGAVRRYPGVSAERLREICRLPSVATVKVHVHQINSLLEATNVRITGRTPEGGYGYRIVTCG
jgi:hypothetical protein